MSLSNFEMIPLELLNLICLKINLRDYFALLVVSKTFNRVLRNEQLQRSLCDIEGITVDPTLSCEENLISEYKSAYGSFTFPPNYTHKFWNKYSVPPISTLLTGLQNTGKTKLLYQLYLEEDVPTIPTIGFNVEQFGPLYIMDYGHNLTLLRHYSCPNMIWVINAWEEDKLELSREQFNDIIKYIEFVKILIFVNKHSTLKNVGIHKIIKLFKFEDLSVPWMVQTINVNEICQTHKPDKYKDVLKGLSFMTDYEWNSVGELRSFKPEAGYCVVSPFDVFRLIKSYFKF